MKEERPDIRYVTLPFELPDSHREGVPRPSTQDPNEVANLGGVSDYLARMHTALECSSATGQPGKRAPIPLEAGDSTVRPGKPRQLGASGCHLPRTIAVPGVDPRA